MIYASVEASVHLYRAGSGRQAINTNMKMRDMINILTESTEDGWQRIRGPEEDVTGDLSHDIPEEFDAHLVDKTPADPGDRFSGDIYTFMNAEKTIKIVMTPRWDASNGNYSAISVYKRA